MGEASGCAAPQSALEAVLGAGGAVVLAPHPDDETLGCGALLAASFALRRPTHVVVVTDGSGSHPGSSAWPPARLAECRAAEAVEAVRRLGGTPDAVSFLGFADRTAPSGGPALQAAVEQVLAILEATPGATLLAPSAADPHCDHQATARLAWEVRARRPSLRLLFYPVWSRQPNVRAETGGRLHRFPLGPYAAAKRRALAAHRSQLGEVVQDDPHGFVLPPEFVAMFLGEDELFLEAGDALSNA